MTEAESTFEDEAPPGIEQPTHILLVDDDLNSLGLLLAYLRDYDFAISTAANAAEGLALATRDRPDLILLDLTMPGEDGFSLLQRIKAAPRTAQIPVVLLTGRDDMEAKLHGFALGAADFLTKPVAEAELHARITAHLRRDRLLTGLERRLKAYELRYGPIGDEPLEDNDLPRQEIDRLYKARQLLRERLEDPPSLNELAAAVGTNQPRLSRGFRALFGTTVYGYLRETRLERARELLLKTRWPIKTIALEVGYRSPADLTRGIKERFGVTPTALREGQ